MKRQRKNELGITLIALVISIIVMLILAGVSLNATIGENGIVTRAQEAAKQHKIATELENLNLELAKMNIDTISLDSNETISEIIDNLISSKIVTRAVTRADGTSYIVGYDIETGEQYFFVATDENTYKISRGNDGILAAELVSEASGGDVSGGYTLVTLDNFTNSNNDSLPESEKGKYKITSNAEVAFFDSISGTFSIYVESGVTATVGIYAKMELTNSNSDRSAIHIEEGGVLKLYIADGVECIVNSGYGKQGDVANGLGAKGGPGGYAGIHVTWTDTDQNGKFDLDKDSYGTLELYGSGKIIAYGGKAGFGGGAVSGNTGGGRRRWSRCWNRWRWWNWRKCKYFVRRRKNQ